MSNHYRESCERKMLSLFPGTKFFFPFRLFSVILIIFIALVFPSFPLSAEEDAVPLWNRFRIENTLQIQKADEIVEIKTFTIFNDGIVFDFIGDNGEITIYDEQKRHFTLLDPIHRIQTELTENDLEDFLAHLREKLLDKKEKFYRFILQPAFEVSRNDESGELLFQSKWIDYRISSRSFDDPSLCQEYFNFSDAYSRLNIYLNPGTFTPLARMKVNETLAAEKRFPAQITVTVYPKGKWFFAKSIKMESKHKIIHRLSEEDQGRIVRALLFCEQFPKVTFGNYFKTVTPNDSSR